MLRKLNICQVTPGRVQIFWRLDNKEAVDISSIPNENLRKLLECIFDCLKLLKVKEVSPRPTPSSVPDMT